MNETKFKRLNGRLNVAVVVLSGLAGFVLGYELGFGLAGVLIGIAVGTQLTWRPHA